jgi:uncharacterized SAM-binding protein YcdF (DUF218 family)
MDKIYIVLNYLVEGSDPTRWILVKFIIAFIGWAIAYLAKKDFLTRPGEVKLKFYPFGLLYSLIAAFGWLILLSPTNLWNAFVSWIFWIWTIQGLLYQKNQWASNTDFEYKTLTPTEIVKQYQESLTK